MEEETALLHRARDWCERDPNPRTSRFVKELIARHATEDETPVGGGGTDLRSLFPDGRRIGFGTAGLRGRMQPGPLGMNDLIVVQTAQGLAQHLLRTFRGDDAAALPPLKAVVGYDHRSNLQLALSSKRFAILTKLVFERAGIVCTLLDGIVPTPLLAFAVTHLDASTGIMVTASHNPKMDNGYKVYWNDGCQIRPPMDGDIAAAILEEESLAPWTDYGRRIQDLEEAETATAVTGHCHGLSDPEETQQIANAYFHAVSLSGLAIDDPKRAAATTPPRFAYTAMHGVGHPFAVRAFETFKLAPFLAVPSQCDPDPNFPTVPFPNPEERGALDEAKAFAAKNGCDVVLANDPDADRLGVAERGREGGEWTVFTGDQIGTLLGHWLWETLGKNSEKPVAMCASTVSSKMIGAIAEAEGFRFEETLTGFKWIGSRALALKDEGYNVLLGYEEAIGFSCGGVVPDKDGLTAIGVIATLAHHIYAQGKSLSSHLEDLHAKYGEFVSRNGYFRCDDPDVALKIMDGMRNGGEYFKRVGSYDVASVRDLGSPGYDSARPDGRPTLPTSASSPMISFRFANGCVAQFRASGTEPKFKFYIEMRGKIGESKDEVKQKLTKIDRKSVV